MDSYKSVEAADAALLLLQTRIDGLQTTPETILQSFMDNALKTSRQLLETHAMYCDPSSNNSVLAREIGILEAEIQEIQRSLAPKTAKLVEFAQIEINLHCKE